MADRKLTWEEVNRNIALFLEALRFVSSWRQQATPDEQPPPAILEASKVIGEFFSIEPPESFLELLHEPIAVNLPDDWPHNYIRSAAPRSVCTSSRK